jgi:hypothetical protein
VTGPLVREAASFRDPAASVFYADDRVFRGLRPAGAADWAALVQAPFFQRLVDGGQLIGTTAVASDALPAASDIDSFDLVLEHERIPFVSYPYEWTFEMLRDAAHLHLEVLLAALDDGIAMKDGYAYNVQWHGARPVFIDIGSFEPVRGGAVWPGYRQFCQTMLFPLLLEAHLGVAFQPFLAGSLEGLTPGDMRRMLRGRLRFKRGVFRNVYLHSVIEGRSTKTGTEAVKEELGRAGLGVELAKATTKKLLKLVGGLRSPHHDSNWSAYRETCSYSDADSKAKERFVRDIASTKKPSVAWDLGCNDGAFARIVAEHAGTVIAADSDPVVVDGLYRSLRADGPANVLPLVMDLLDPSPARGWRGRERRAFDDRGRPDLVLALALVHHLALAGNVPIAEVVDWLASLSDCVVVEFVDRHDPMAERLLANKPRGVHDDYERAGFEAALAAKFDVKRREELPGGSRVLYAVEARG